LTQPFNWKRLALIGALAINTQGKRIRLLLSIHADTVNSERVTAFLRGLRRHIPGRILLLWDGLPSHRSAHTAQFLADSRHWLRVERLSAYAPELNPVEYLWGHLTATRPGGPTSPRTIWISWPARSARAPAASAVIPTCPVRSSNTPASFLRPYVTVLRETQ
jgi:hypothetical protein